MKKFLAIFILSLCLCSHPKLDDVNDFEIEGVSLGDSALELFSTRFCKLFSQNYPGNKFRYYRFKKNFTFYDAVQITVKQFR